MEFVDTHTHLFFENLQKDLPGVLHRARDQHVVQIICLGTDAVTSEQSVKIAEQHSGIFAAVGIHPTEAHRMRADDLDTIARLASHPRVVAIGEIGLDFYWKEAPPGKQYEVLTAMLELARQLRKPVVIHSRSAIRQLRQFFAEKGWNTLAGVMHCFEGNVEDARFFLDRGMFISFAGNVTFPKFRRQEVVRFVPVDRLLLETDSPFLSPHPYRGKPNEPSRLPIIAGLLAEWHGISIDDLAQRTTGNARRLFGLPESVQVNKE